MVFRRCACCTVGGLLLAMGMALSQTNVQANGNVPTRYEDTLPPPNSSKPKSWPRQYGEYESKPIRERGDVRATRDEIGGGPPGMFGYYGFPYGPYYGYWGGYYGFYRPWYNGYGWYPHYGY